MLNIEKYKDVIPNMKQANIACCVRSLIKGKCIANCKECKKEALEWLTEESKEPVLDDVEKQYLSNIITPFGDRVKYIYLTQLDDYVYIVIYVKSIRRKTGSEVINLPLFEKCTMYKGMVTDRHYSLKELGL